MKHVIQDAKFSMQKRLRAAAVCISTFAFCIATPEAQQQPGMPGSMGHRTGIVASNVPPQFKEVTFSQRLGQPLPLDARFKDENGRDVRLGDYFGKRPVVLAFVYFQCPLLCSQTMNGISSALKAVPFTAGKDFDVVLISFDPRDTPEAAMAKKRAHIQHWNIAEDADAWHFLTGREEDIRQAASAAGFTYKWDDPTQQFAHVSGLLTTTTDGRLSRYFYGVEYSPKDLRLAIAESSGGRIGSLVEELLLYCYQYDPTTGQYGAVVMNLVRLGGVVTLALVVGFVVLMRRREMRQPAESV